jgi:hypothetical protein
MFRWLIGCEPVSITAQALGQQSAAHALEDVSATLQFADGSLATLIYTSVGTTTYGKERLEVFRGGQVLVLDDYRRLEIRGKTRLDQKNASGDKGHGAELDHFAGAILGRHALGIDHRDGIVATLCCLAIAESVVSGQPVQLRVESEQ